MKRTLGIVILALASLTLSAQEAPQQQKVTGFARIFWTPTAETVKLDPNDGPVRSTVENPDFTEALLEIYRPIDPTTDGTCIIMCPGGGYSGEAQSYEGRDFAPWFCARGITYCMLQYRLPAGRHDVPLQDAERAIRYLREHAKELGISRIGIMGCSAGGHLASTLATHYSSAETRPDFQILLYPVITMETPYTHMGSRECLLGKDAPQTLVDLYSNEKQVTKDTPKAFIVLASDDMLVPVQNSTRYYEALVANGVEATLMCYPTGNHGFGHHETFLYRENWFNELETWIEKSL